MPKPLVNIAGRPMLFWILDNLDLAPQDTLWIALMDDMDQNFSIGHRVKQQFPKVNIKIIPLRYDASTDLGCIEIRKVHVSCDMCTVYMCSS